MQFTILTLFPKAFSCVFASSIIKRALTQGKIKINYINIRDFTNDKHRTVDDKPFGGGVGMILKVAPIFAALKKAKGGTKNKRTILLTPQGKVFNQKTARRLTRYDHLILICGHYEGVDERVGEYLTDEQISIGDYILTGGEIPAMVIVDAVTRLLPGVLPKKEAICCESFQTHKRPTSDISNLRLPTSNFQLLEPPQYTRPADFFGMKVPPILLSGNHQNIQEWRYSQALEKTRKRRPDLLAKVARK